MSTPSRRTTRAKNATTHPGAVVLAAQGKRRTKVQKQADDERTAAEQAALTKAEEERIITIAKMVMELRAKEQNAANSPVSHANQLALPILALTRMALKAEALPVPGQASGATSSPTAAVVAGQSR